MEIEDYTVYMVTSKHINDYSNLVGTGSSPIELGFDHMDQIGHIAIEKVFAAVAGKDLAIVVDKAPAVIFGEGPDAVADKASAAGIGMVLIVTNGYAPL